MAISLKTRISLSLLVAFIVVAGIATFFAKASFRDMEYRHAEDDSQARVDAVSELVDTRFMTLGREAKAAADDASSDPATKVLDEMKRAGFTTAILLGKDGAVNGTIGEAATNASLRESLATSAPPPDYPATMYRYENGWFIVSARSSGLRYAVVGAMSEQYLSDGYLVDALIHPEYGHAIVMDDGRIMARSANYDSLAGTPVETRSKSEPVALDAHVIGRAPTAPIESRVDAMTIRFVLSMAVAFGIGGSVTILLVAYSFRPLDRITEAAKRLGRGEEDLKLDVRGADELAELAQTIDRSARALANARRAELVRAEEARLAAEDFELAVGELSRQVGEGDTPHEVAARLADALLRVTSATHVVVRHGDETLASAGRDVASGAADALYLSAPELWHRTRDGEFEVAIFPAALPAGEDRKIDILAAQASIGMHRARAAVDLRRAKAQKETFLDILSHDLKNPIAVARGRVELLERKHPESVEKLQQVQASLDRATKIIEEAVLLSKLERGDALLREPTDMGALVEESASALRPLATPRGIEIQVEAPTAAKWPVNRLIQRAVENLMSNAIKWSPENGSVEVRVVPDDHACLVLVVDHGPGIPDEDKKRLFARFERADRSGVKGTGLGLAIALRVTQMHGGAIRIEDTPGGGSTFVLELPDITLTTATTTPGVRA